MRLFPPFQAARPAPALFSLAFLCCSLSAIASALLPEHAQSIAAVPNIWYPIHFMYLWDRAARRTPI